MRLHITILTTSALVAMTASAALADLTLPTKDGKKVFDGFKIEGPSGRMHPSLTKRSETAKVKSGNSGAWEAHNNSDKIDCADCPDSN